jgi:DNA topoisomerase VI subunit B
VVAIMPPNEFRPPAGNRRADENAPGEELSAAVSLQSVPRRGPAAQLDRATFTTSRLLDFFSEKELIAQTGHSTSQWPIVVLKELVDNALDACEEANVAPDIEIVVDDTGITVIDNGPGIPAKTVAAVLDYSVRVSSREAYIAPDRGAQGNALKTIVAMPFVLDGTVGRLTVTAGGVRHEIEVRVDPIRQVPVITHDQFPADVSIGTRVTVHWPVSARWILDQAESRFLQMASGYVWTNPHLRLTVDWFGEQWAAEPTDPVWPKWRPSEPTSPHWYQLEHLERLIAAHVAHEAHAGMSVREFITGFRGLSGSAKGKQVLAQTGMARTMMADLANGELHSEAIARLLIAMCDHSRSVKPAQLGVIGRDHMAARFAELGGEMDSFTYKKIVGETDSLPWVVEIAFCWRPGLGRAQLVTGVNWSPGIGNPFRSMGRYETSLDTLLQQQRVDEDCILVLHLACPRVSYTDRGKSAVVIPASNGWELSEAITSGIESVTAKWAKQRKAEERAASARSRRRQAMSRAREMTIRDAAWEVMPAAYNKASDYGALPANARQIMYAARPDILAMTGKGEIDDAYFTQTLLPDYIREHGLEDEWDVAYDARGHLTEPHRNRLSGPRGMTHVPLGTLEVRAYLQAEAAEPLAISHVPTDFPTVGPTNRYSAVMFLEKEGFTQLLDRARISDRYDLGIMSTKGMSVVAARKLIDELTNDGVRVFVVRDFDIAGFSIATTLTGDTRRYEFDNAVDVVDLGIRLGDVHEYGLVSEPWAAKGARRKIERRLRLNGATSEEVDFIVRRGDYERSSGQRVELNAFTSSQFVGWLEAKLDEHGVHKVIPDAETLALQYRRSLARRAVNRKIDEIEASARADAAQAAIPGDLADRVRDLLDEDDSMSWDDAVTQIVMDTNGGG